MVLTPVLARSGLDTVPASHEATSSDSPQTEQRAHHTLRTGSPDLAQVIQELHTPSVPRGEEEASNDRRVNGLDDAEEAGDRVGVALGSPQRVTYVPRRPSVLREASVENSYEVSMENNALSKEPEQVVSGDQSKPLSPVLANSPALQFILRKDLYSFLSSAGVSQGVKVGRGGLGVKVGGVEVCE